MAAAGAAHWRARAGRARDLSPTLPGRHRAAPTGRRRGGRPRFVRRPGGDWRHRAGRAGPRACTRHVLPTCIGRMNVVARLVSLALLILAWTIGAQLAGPRLLPDPQTVALAIVNEARSGALIFNLSATLARVAVAFVIAMLLGSVIGLVMGRS